MFIDSIQVLEPTEIQISSTITDVSCYNAMDGVVMLNVSGGSPSYLYGIDSGPYTSFPVYNNLDKVLYEFTILDANNCQDFVSVIIEQSDSLFFSSTNIVDVIVLAIQMGCFSAGYGGHLPYLYGIDLLANSQLERFQI